MGGVTPRRGCRVGLSFSVTASVTLMRICLRLLLSHSACPLPHEFILNGKVLFGQTIKQKLKKRPWLAPESSQWICKAAAHYLWALFYTGPIHERQLPWQQWMYMIIGTKTSERFWLTFAAEVNSKTTLTHNNVAFTLSEQLLFAVPWANVLLSTGQQTLDHEEGRHPDAEPQDVQQVQEEQTCRGRLWRALQVHAGQGLTLWRRARHHQPHDPHGSPSPL